MTRELPPTSSGLRSRLGKHSFGGLTATLCLGLLIGMAPAAPASADDLEARRNQLNAKMGETRNQIDEFNGQVSKAISDFDASREQLAAAEAKLAKAESDVTEAKRQDDARASELKTAESELKAAQDEVAAARAALQKEKEEVGEVARETMIGQTSLAEFALFLDDVSTSDIGGKMQYAETVFDIRSANLDSLTAAQYRMEAAEQRAADAKQKADDAKKAAASQLAQSKQAEDAAAAARKEVADLVAKNATVKQQAENVLENAKSELAKQEAEGRDLDRRIQERIAEQKRIEAERAARERAERSKNSGSSSSSSSSSSGGGSSSGGSGYQSNTSLKWPANGRPGSPFGMRYHPILHYSRMHWGTDIGASCGSPLYAAGDGVMTEVGWNGGYGNHAVLDVGKVNGSYLSIGYAHATRYVVHKGQHVSKGEVIGYVGTTGLSTGCHLHLEAWQNGKKVNPMSFF